MVLIQIKADSLLFICRINLTLVNNYNNFIKTNNNNNMFGFTGFHSDLMTNKLICTLYKIQKLNI